MIIVTGASKGIGKSIALRLISLGYEVLGISRSIENIKFNSLSCDVSSFKDVKKIRTQIKKEGIKITGLINSAGIASMNLAIFTPQSMTDSLISTNLLGTIYCCQQFSPFLIREKKGFIINFSTIAVALGIKGESIYVASKAGIEGFTKSFAREMSDFRINVNCIAPGPVKTNLLKGISNNQINKIVSQQIIPKVFNKDDICDIVEILIDKKFSSISGQTIHVGGI